jgi:hypothetical protein
MSDFIAVEFDALTNQTTEREMTAEEIAELETLQAEATTAEAAEQAKAAARVSALAKLAELGLTEEEVAAL